ncbi:MAG: M55 family metallopeptidase [Marinilabiliales bacterium]|nr:M55 family metallopeptidase [Marinilabiliales bacterium]
MQEIIGKIETAAVKDAMGPAASMIHPTKAQEMIRKGVAAALRNLKAYKPYKPALALQARDRLHRREPGPPGRPGAGDGADGRAFGGLHLERLPGDRQVLLPRPPVIKKAAVPEDGGPVRSRVVRALTWRPGQRPAAP